jgi:acyl carrier protein
MQDEDDETFVSPRNAVEAVLAQMWMEVLRLDRVGVFDDFFELGGHSLLIMQVIARLRDAFRIELPPASFFNATTIADLARMVVAQEEQAGQMEKIAVIIQRLDQMSDEDAQATLDERRRPAEEQARAAGDQA